MSGTVVYFPVIQGHKNPEKQKRGRVVCFGGRVGYENGANTEPVGSAWFSSMTQWPLSTGVSVPAADKAFPGKRQCFPGQQDADC